MDGYGMTVVGIRMTSDEAVRRHLPASKLWFEAARKVELDFYEGEFQLLGVLDNGVDMVGTIENLPKGPPVWRPDVVDPPMRYTVFGYDWAAGEALAIVAEARHWASAAFAVILQQPRSYQFVCVAEGVIDWADQGGATWQTLREAAASAEAGPRHRIAL